MTQNNVSRLESPDYGKHTITSLKRVADALDVALVVRFEPFSQYIDWLSGTPHWNYGINPSSLAVPSFECEEEKGVFDRNSQSRPELILFPKGKIQNPTNPPLPPPPSFASNNITRFDGHYKSA